MNLDDIRSDIDMVDSQLIALLEQRMDLVSQVATYKKMTGARVLDNSREIAILDKVSNRVKEPLFTETIVNTFRDILKNSRAYQEQTLKD
ncbi:MAG: chorismate mutase [Lactococcus plantarum]|nr:chorismate mutase [Lactococcus plantarum]MDN6084100.1 chorismate mutase [Lactococcus plantarum]